MAEERRSLAQSGGPSAVWGNADLGRTLADCMEVDPSPKLKFTHGFHAYPGRMHPETARRLLKAFAPAGTRVLDPFVGSGTVALEAMLAGLPFTGVDLLRVPLEIAWTRTRVLKPAECRKLAAIAAKITNVARERRDDGVELPDWAKPEREWYAPHTLREICRMRDMIDGVADARLRRILVCVLSSLLVKLSKQPSDSRPHIAREASGWAPDSAYRLFRDKASELARSLAALSANLHKRRAKPPEPRFVQGDARFLPFVPRSFQLVVTSPPYPGVYDYALHHGRRHPLFGAETVGREIGARRDIGDRPEGLEIYRGELKRWLDAVRVALSGRGRAAVLIGDGMTGGRPVFTDQMIRDLSVETGFRVLAGASQPRPDWTAGGRGRIRREHLILLELSDVERDSSDL